jgi:hypothetical protein
MMSPFRYWHRTDQPGQSGDVRSSGRAGSGVSGSRRLLLTLTGHATAWTEAIYFLHFEVIQMPAGVSMYTGFWRHSQSTAFKHRVCRSLH